MRSPTLANFQGDFDFTATKGFILRVSAGIDAETRIATWLLQVIDPDTGEQLNDSQRGLLVPDATNADAKRGYVTIPSPPSPMLPPVPKSVPKHACSSTACRRKTAHGLCSALTTKRLQRPACFCGDGALNAQGLVLLASRVIEF
jgi:hypothetical protein